ncbi:MAG: rod shape-determining protein RodA [Phycisphaerae bacterium]|nr:MAG: rod shape-determining protein RodA [Phycisphaerae bacterium]
MSIPARKLRQLALSQNWPILVSVGILSCLGVLTLWSDDPSAGQKQLIFFVIAAGCMAAFQAVDYRIIGKYAGWFYIGSALLIMYTVLGSMLGGVPGVSKRNGAFNWIDFGPLALQPAELMKVAFVMVMARYLRFRSNYRTLQGLVPPFLLAAFPIVLILKQPDLGTALVFIPTLFAMLFIAGARLKHLLGVVGMGVALLPLIWLSGLPGVPVFEHLPSIVKEYQRDRVYAMFSNDPDVESIGTGMQQYRALVAMGSGGLFGKGIGEIQAGERVPERRNDMIFALIGEQFGFIGSFVVIAAYLVIIFVGLEIAGSTREPFGRLVAVGIITLLAGQTFINLMVATKLMPVTGVTLPFVSSGGSSLIASFMIIGLLINIGQRRPIVMGDEAFEFRD